jgi:hypothetical protein
MDQDLLTLGSASSAARVSEYVRNQGSLLEYYADLGHKEHSSHNPQTDYTITRAFLETPVLKARVPAPHIHGTDTKQGIIQKRERSRIKENIPQNGKLGTTTVKDATKDNEHKSSKAGLPNAVLRSAFVTIYYSGLVERKDRRRAKRAILQDMSSSDNGDQLSQTHSNSSTYSRKKRTRHQHHKNAGKRKSKTYKPQSKLPSGLSLMESFAAKNVPKGRLTVRFNSLFTT